MQSDNFPARVVVRDGSSGTWLEFASPRRIVTTHRIAEVLPFIRDIEETVQREGWYAAGFISYEASPAFDPSLPVKEDGAFPLLWFGLFDQPNKISLPVVPPESGPSIAWHPSVSREEYERCIHDIREHIRNGDTYQVNFTYRLRGVTDRDPWELFLRMAGDGQAPFAAFVDTGTWAICSASPELFLRIDGTQIASRPMKGTSARGLWFEDDQAKKEALVSSGKQRAENDDRDYGPQRSRPRGGVRERAGAAPVHGGAVTIVWQLTSTVVARTDEPLDRILQATFPPASITGAPKRRTMEIIAELETEPRRIYTGTIGYIAPGRTVQLNVAIRTVLMHRPTGSVEYGVGGGVVWDSTAAGEYEESLTKTKALAPLPRDFDLLETLLWSPGTGYALMEHHLTRLSRSAASFNFVCDPVKIRGELAVFAGGLAPGRHRIRLLVSRAGNIRCEAVSMDQAALQFGDVALAAGPIDRNDVFLYHKTTRRAVYEAAIRSCPGSNDVLLFNEAGEVTETTIANIAVEIGGVLYTPPVRCGLLPGTQRAMMLEQGLLLERVLTVDEVLAGPEICLLNSVRGMQRVQVRGGDVPV
ncbi:MAG: chorismate-binding protein [Ignavibacteriae bacterium]|nr:chorismate-binding protein [Ignavibacteriota bacterium]